MKSRVHTQVHPRMRKCVIIRELKARNKWAVAIVHRIR